MNGWMWRLAKAEAINRQAPSSKGERTEPKTVGDSPRGPLKQQGNPRLKHATKPNTPRLTMQDTTHAAEAPNGPPRLPSRRSPRAGFASLEDARPPRVGAVPLEGEHLPRAGSASPEGPLPPQTGSASLEGSLPSNEVRLARGVAHLERGPPRSRAPRARAPAPVRWHLMA
jgi:hypothetical protein